MRIEIDENPDKNDIKILLSKLIEYNMEHLDIKEKKPVAVWCRDMNNQIAAGVSGHTFGHWLEIDYFCVDKPLRGTGVGSQLLKQMEETAVKRGCRFTILNTFSFQAKPFYEKHGYKEIFHIENYPKTSSKHFLIKAL